MQRKDETSETRQNLPFREKTYETDYKSRISPLSRNISPSGPKINKLFNQQTGINTYRQSREIQNSVHTTFNKNSLNSQYNSNQGPNNNLSTGFQILVSNNLNTNLLGQNSIVAQLKPEEPKAQHRYQNQNMTKNRPGDVIIQQQVVKNRFKPAFQPVSIQELKTYAEKLKSINFENVTVKTKKKKKTNKNTQPQAPVNLQINDSANNQSITTTNINNKKQDPTNPIFGKNQQMLQYRQHNANDHKSNVTAGINQLTQLIGHSPIKQSINNSVNNNNQKDNNFHELSSIIKDAPNADISFDASIKDMKEILNENFEPKSETSFITNARYTNFVNNHKILEQSKSSNNNKNVFHLNLLNLHAGSTNTTFKKQYIDHNTKVNLSSSTKKEIESDRIKLIGALSNEKVQMKKISTPEYFNPNLSINSNSNNLPINYNYGNANDEKFKPLISLDYEKQNLNYTLSSVPKQNMKIENSIENRSIIEFTETMNSGVINNQNKMQNQNDILNISNFHLKDNFYDEMLDSKRIPFNNQQFDLAIEEESKIMQSYINPSSAYKIDYSPSHSIQIMSNISKLNPNNNVKNDEKTSISVTMPLNSDIKSLDVERDLSRAFKIKLYSLSYAIDNNLLDDYYIEEISSVIKEYNNKKYFLNANDMLAYKKLENAVNLKMDQKENIGNKNDIQNQLKCDAYLPFAERNLKLNESLNEQYSQQLSQNHILTAAPNNLNINSSFDRINNDFNNFLMNQNDNNLSKITSKTIKNSDDPKLAKIFSNNSKKISQGMMSNLNSDYGKIFNHNSRHNSSSNAGATILSSRDRTRSLLKASLQANSNKGQFPETLIGSDRDDKVRSYIRYIHNSIFINSMI